MRLHEAIETGKKFKRIGQEDFVTSESFLEDIVEADILASDYEVMVDVSVTVTKTDFDAAWNASRAGSNSIKPAGQSEFYKKLSRQLGIVE